MFSLWKVGGNTHAGATVFRKSEELSQIEVMRSKMKISNSASPDSLGLRFSENYDRLSTSLLIKLAFMPDNRKIANVTPIFKEVVRTRSRKLLASQLNICSH